MMTIFKKILSDESGQGLVEYSLILFLVAIAVVIVVRELGDSVNDLYKTIEDKMDAL